MAKKTRNAIVTRCAECDSRIYFRIQPEIGLTLTCNECGTHLEVIGLNPIELDWVYNNYYERVYDDYDEYEI